MVIAIEGDESGLERGGGGEDFVLVFLGGLGEGFVGGGGESGDDAIVEGLGGFGGDKLAGEAGIEEEDDGARDFVEVSADAIDGEEIPVCAAESAVVGGALEAVAGEEDDGGVFGGNIIGSGKGRKEGAELFAREVRVGIDGGFFAGEGGGFEGGGDDVEVVLGGREGRIAEVIELADGKEAVFADGEVWIDGEGEGSGDGGSGF